jgi:hypothetical protein
MIHGATHKAPGLQIQPTDGYFGDVRKRQRSGILSQYLNEINVRRFSDRRTTLVTRRASDHPKSDFRHFSRGQASDILFNTPDWNERATA